MSDRLNTAYAVTILSKTAGDHRHLPTRRGVIDTHIRHKLVVTYAHKATYKGQCEAHARTNP